MSLCLMTANEHLVKYGHCYCVLCECLSSSFDSSGSFGDIKGFLLSLNSFSNIKCVVVRNSEIGEYNIIRVGLEPTVLATTL